MPAYSSHLLQPLDVGCFSPLKRVYQQLTEEWSRLGIRYIKKLDFLEVYPSAHNTTFTSQNIQNGFAAAGIISFNP